MTVVEMANDITFFNLSIGSDILDASYKNTGP